MTPRSFKRPALRAILAATAWLLATQAGAQDAGTDRLLGDRLVDNLLARDYMFYGNEALHYAEAAAAVGALRFVAETGDEARQAELVGRYAPLLDDSSPLVSLRAHVDMSVLGIVPLQVALLTGDGKALEVGLGFADRQWSEPTEEGLTGESRWWVDDLYMVGMLQIQAYRASREARYADRAARQLAAYLPRLQQPNGLFHHGPEAPFFWGRGNGWVAVALAEVLHSLPADHPQRGLLVERHRLMMEALLPLQTPEGAWRQLLDDPEAWPETSGTAMFAYAMSLGMADGLLDVERFGPAVERAWMTLQDYLDDDGNLREVCVGTGKSDDRAFYLARPRVTGDLHGQAPMLWLVTRRLSRPGVPRSGS